MAIRITRRRLGLGVAVSTAAIAGLTARVVDAADPEPSGLMLVHLMDASGEGRETGRVVLDLGGGEARPIDIPADAQLEPVPGTSYVVARTETAMLVVDAEAATVTEVAPPAGMTTAALLIGDRTQRPSTHATSTRHLILTDGLGPRYLVDLGRATSIDLVDAFAPGETVLRTAELTADGTRLHLAADHLVVGVSLATMTIEGALETTEEIRSTQLSPSGAMVAVVEPKGEGRTQGLRLLRLDGSQRPATLVPGGAERLRCRWITEDALLLASADGGGGTALSRLDLDTGATTPIAEIPGDFRDAHVLANGSRVIVSTDTERATEWRLVDLDAGLALPLPELDAMIPHGPLPIGTRAVVFGPEEQYENGVEGRSFVVLNTATAALVSLVEQLDGPLYFTPEISPDGRSAVIGTSGLNGRESWMFWICDLVAAATISVGGYMGASYSPDSRFLLTNPDEPGSPLEIRSLDGALVRELDLYDGGWWLG